MVEHILRGCPRLALQIAQGMGEMRFEDNQARGGIIIGDIGAGCGADMHPGKIGAGVLLCSQASLDFIQHCLFV